MPRHRRRAPRGTALWVLAVAVVGALAASTAATPAGRATRAAGPDAAEARRAAGGEAGGTVRDRRSGARMGGQTAGVPDVADTVPGGAAATGATYTPVSVANDTSPPLRDLPPSTAPRGQRIGPDGEVEEGSVRHDRSPHPVGGGPDPVAQRDPAGLSAQAISLGASFDGPGNGVSTVQWVPPDPNSAVGPNHVVTVVNTDLIVQSKTGTTVYGPVGTSTVWSGFPGACSTTNDGDAVVRYDRSAARWVITQFANADSATGPFYECVAVSTGTDPTGSWNRYVYQFANFPDYPKLSVWGDAYVITYNMFAADGSMVPQVCGMQRAAMLAGTAAAQRCFSLGAHVGSPLAADNDGAAAPPAGAGLPVLAMDDRTSTSLPSWTIRFDWTTPANSTITGPTAVTVASFSPACGGGNCIPQPSGTNVLPLDSMGDRLMYRLAYRNFGGYEAMVVAHSVTTGGVIGVRWYELRRTGSTLSVFQQGTYVPDASTRWMPSIALDGSGGIAVGYSLSSSSIYPSLAATGRRAGDPTGQMSQPEVRLVTGQGSQNAGIQRWGDYFSMNVDPSDDCTFWFTGEYQKATVSQGWSTRVSSFTLPGCTGTPAPDFSLAVSPASSSVSPGGTATTTVRSTLVSGAVPSVALSASGLPAGASATFTPASVAAGGSSTLTVTTTGSTPVGTYPITVTGTGSSVTRTTAFSLVVASNFTVGVNPSSTTVGRGTSTTVAVATTAVGSPQNVTLSATGLPSGVSATFSPAVVTAGSSSTLTLTAGASATIGTASVTVRGVGAAGTRTAALGLKVLAANPVVNPRFETARLTPWTATGTVAVVGTNPRAGRYSARLGSTTRTNGDSRIVQTFTTPAGATQVSFWYRSVCPDLVTSDWSTATLTDNVTRTSATVLPRTCSATGVWRQVTWPLQANRSYTLTLVNHDDNQAGDPTFTQFDSVVVG